MFAKFYDGPRLNLTVSTLEERHLSVVETYLFCPEPAQLRIG